MKNLLYIGNQLSQKDKTETTIDTLGKNLIGLGYNLVFASNYKSIFFRFIHMLLVVLKNRKTTNYVLIDTYSTLNFYYAYAVSQLCRFLSLEYIPILHGGNLPERLKKSPKFSKKIFINAYKNISPSKYIEKSFNEFGYSNIEVIPNSIEIKKYPLKERTLETVKLLWVRSFSEIYNPNLAIDVLFELLRRGVKASLCMVGPEKDGSLDKAKEYAKSLNIEVKFTGKLEKEEWIALSENFNVFINTTNFDNMPVSVIEAMALGLPVISTNVGGMPFLINNEVDGVLVAPNNVEDFIKAILEIKCKPEKTIDMAASARKKVEQFDWNIVKKQWIKLLQ